MANEITATASIAADRGACSFTRKYTKKVDQTTADMFAEVVTVNGDVALSFGLSTEGWLWMQNISENGANVDIGPEVTAAIHPIMTLHPQQIACFRLDPAITVRANGTLATLYYVVLED